MNRAEKDKPSEWLQVGVEAAPDAVEAVSEVLSRYGHQGGVVIQQAYRPADDGVTLIRDPSGPAFVCTYIPRDRGIEETLQRLRADLDILGELFSSGPVQIHSLVEEDWAHSWKAHYTILRIGERLVIVPAWLEFDAAEGDIVLTMDPGMAFGTGLHATTQLCLRALEQYLEPGMGVLDLGAGSGILSIAAAKLGGGSVLALDTDPLAVEASRQNIQANQVGDRIAVREASLHDGMGPFDLILVNILARTIQELAGLLAASLASGGVLIASGILLDQAEGVMEALAAAGLCLLDQLEQEEWVGLVLRSRS